MSPPITLLMLPSELIEAVLICSCSPRTVASVAQTCRKLHTLVYTSPDSHLWRGLFLTIWDDPRPALEHRALIDPRIYPTTWDWGIEYRRRVSADKWLKAWRRDICLPDDTNTSKHADSEWRTTALSALTALLDTFLTLKPFPVSPPVSLTVLNPEANTAENVGPGVENSRQRMRNAPPFPPLLIVLMSRITIIKASRSGERLGRIVYGPHVSVPRPSLLASSSSSLERVQTPIPTPSLPPQLVRTLLAVQAVGVRGLPAYKPFLSSAGHWGVDPLGDVFHQIVCITGFVPIPPPIAATSVLAGMATATSSAGTTDSKDPEPGTAGDEEQREGTDGSESDKQPADMRQTSKAFPTPLEQHADARVLARRRVYDMQYLRADRMWGPYHVVTRVPLDARPGSSPVDGRNGQPHEDAKRAGESESGRGGVHGLGTLAWAMGADVEPDELDSDSTSDDSKDEDWYDPADPSQGYSASTVDANVDADAEPAELEHPLISLILANSDATNNAHIDPITNMTSTTSPRQTRPSNYRLTRNTAVSPREIKSHHLRPDYAYLASARIVVEADLRDLFRGENSANVNQTASGVRPGGVGMFWEDEDEILRERARSVEPASSAPHFSSSTGTAPTGMSSTNANSDTFGLADILFQFKNLEVARLGSTFGYWAGWTDGPPSAKGSINGGADKSVSSPESIIGMRRRRIVKYRAQLESPAKGSAPATRGRRKGKARDFESGLGDWEIGPEGQACEGWDWAGVGGIWRRCVCWMDYRELLSPSTDTFLPFAMKVFNLDSSKFLSLDTQEACRIIPMELRVTGYSRAELMPAYDTDERGNINVLRDNKQHGASVCTGFFRPPPVIHFVGASIGSDRGMEDGRAVRGSVELIGGGEVRWQMSTYAQESDMSASTQPEWSSEAVQIGGIGSAVGLLGMWTGAGHERADPLGPFWAWRVG